MTFLTFSRPLNHVFNQAIRQAIRLFLICVLVLLSTTSHARSELDRQSEVDTSFLSPEQAFRLESKQTHDGSLTINWKIAPGYYLYQHRVNVTNKQKETINNVVFLSTPEEKDDPNFGLVQVFHHQLTIKVLPLSDQIWLNYQGCSENGLCYPPQRKMLKVNPAKLALAAELTPTVNPTLEDDAGAITTMLIGADGYWVVLTFFILGLGLALTPCVLPMIPILAGIIAGQGENITLRRGIGLSTAYVLGMAVAYTLTGVLVGYFGAQMNLQASLQSPAALVIFSILFVALALAMFGFYELQLPAFLRDRLNLMGKNHRGGKYISVALMGLISALVVSPCVSAPLAGALVYISTTGDAFFGGASLFALSLGMGAPLILVGVGGGQWLPRAGNWMLDVKAFFGVLLLGVAISLLSRLIPGNSTLLLWSLLAMTYAVHLGNFGQLEPLSPWGKTRRGLSIALMVYGICLMLAGLAGQDDPLKPLDFSIIDKSVEKICKEIYYKKNFELQKKEMEAYLSVLNKEAIVVKTDFDGNITFVNDAFIDISGYLKDEILGKNHSILKHPDVQASLYEEIWETARKGKIWEGTLKHLSKDNETYFVNTKIIPIYDDAGKEITQFISIRFLVTEEENQRRAQNKKFLEQLTLYKKEIANHKKEKEDILSKATSCNDNTKLYKDKIITYENKIRNLLSQLEIYETQNIEYNKMDLMMKQDKKKQLIVRMFSFFEKKIEYIPCCM